MATQSENCEKWIDKYTDLQRIKNASDRDAEIDYQITIAKANLQALGIPTEDLEIKKQ
ncbi:MAG: hypothetical protein IJT32_00205 [Lachnospiraceae bacterium]|nr:hypothetical protein [Lachnospiraceae bacterium]